MALSALGSSLTKDLEVVGYQRSGANRTHSVGLITDGHTPGRYLCGQH